MVEKIRKTDLKEYPAQDGFNRYYAYLTKNDGELVKVTVAVKNKRNNWYCKPVVVHGIHSDKCFGQDMYCYFIAGYVVKWFPEDYIQTQRPMDHDNWGYAQDKLFDPCAYVINREYAAEKFPEYRYSAIEKTTTSDVLKYLRLYERFPQIEYLTKMELEEFVFSKMILSQLKKDKKFVKWIVQNRKEIACRGYYVATILEAYKHNKPLAETQAFLKAKKALEKEESYKPVRALFKHELDKFITYLSKQQASLNMYADYLSACIELGLDMNEEKNRYPHDFKRWHDIRIDEYKTQKAILDENKRREFYQRFHNVAIKYAGLEYNKKAAYIAIIAQKPSDLIHEGEALKHCVGSMNYDQKFVREDSLIFFIRLKDSPLTPFVTVEYSPSKKTVLQCYGNKNSRPEEEVMNFINKKWLPYANRQIRKLAA